MVQLAMAVAETAHARTDVVFALDDDDPARDEAIAAVRATGFPGKFRTGPRKGLAAWTNDIACRAAESYGALASFGDDHMPRTPGWDVRLLNALSGTGIGYGNDLLQGENLPTAPVISSNIVRALGWMCEPSLRHYYVDDVWKTLGVGAGCLVYLPDVVIEHCHPARTGRPQDATYVEAMADWAADEAAYHRWLLERRDADVHTVTKLLG
jgi:hypothetical protein